MKFLETFRQNAAQRAAFVRTIREIRAMPLDVALDLDIDRANAKSVARQAVYGA